MTTQLREEIRDIMHQDLLGNDDVEKRIADEILSLFEKAIEEAKPGFMSIYPRIDKEVNYMLDQYESNLKERVG